MSRAVLQPTKGVFFGVSHIIESRRRRRRSGGCYCPVSPLHFPDWVLRHAVGRTPVDRQTGWGGSHRIGSKFKSGRGLCGVRVAKKIKIKKARGDNIWDSVTCVWGVTRFNFLSLFVLDLTQLNNIWNIWKNVPNLWLQTDYVGPQVYLLPGLKTSSLFVYCLLSGSFALSL